MADPGGDGRPGGTPPGRLWRFLYRLGEAAEGAGGLGAALSAVVGVGGLYLLWRLGYPIAVLLVLLGAGGAGLAYFFLRRRSD